MKKLLLFTWLVAASSLADSWTFHVPANLPISFTIDFATGPNPANGDGEWECLSYDKPWLLDTNSNPYVGDVGWYYLHIFPHWISSGWQLSTNSITPDAGYAFYLAWADSGYPDYFGGDYIYTCTDPGEYWVDFGPGGVPRAQLFQSYDFGEYMWDGSINPSWTAAKKGFAKGHNKQPLPSPK